MRAIDAAVVGEAARHATLPLAFPLRVHWRAEHALRRHMVRALVRTAVLVASDVAAFALLYWLTLGVRDGGWLGEQAAQLHRLLIPRGALPPVEFTAAALLGLAMFGTYRPSDRRRDPRALAAGTGLGLALVSWSRIWSDFSWYGVAGFALAFAVIAGQVIGQRALIELLVRWVRPVNTNAPRVLVVGTQAEARAAYANPAVNEPAEFQLIGYLDTALVPGRGALGGLADLGSVIERYRIETVVLYGHFEDELFGWLVRASDAAGCHVLCVPRAFTLPGYEPQLVWHSKEPLVQLTRPAIRGRHLALKRLTDVVAATLGLVLLAPLFAAIALAVKLTSRGPVFFRQERVGRGGKPFRMWKFRSMVRDAEAQHCALACDSVYADPRLFKLRHDPRVTRLGAFLRRSSLDELPQLWNVLAGDMSLVGPRPPLPTEVALYEDRHFTRLEMKPGMTGPWQVGGRNNITDFEEVVRLEESYMRHWSIWKDVTILFRTLPAVLRMDGAL